MPQVVGSFPIGYFVTVNMTTWRWFTDAKIWRAEQICVPDMIRWEKQNSQPQVISRDIYIQWVHYLCHAAANSNNLNNLAGGETHLKTANEWINKTGMCRIILSRFKRCMFSKCEVQPWKMLFVIINTHWDRHENNVQKLGMSLKILSLIYQLHKQCYTEWNNTLVLVLTTVFENLF